MAAIKISFKVEDVSGVLTEAIREYIARHRVRPVVTRHLDDSIAENEKLGRLLSSKAGILL